MQSQPSPLNFRAMFFLGLILTPAGFGTGLIPIGFLGLGLILFALLNRSRWAK